MDNVMPEARVGLKKPENESNVKGQVGKSGSYGEVKNFSLRGEAASLLALETLC